MSVKKELATQPFIVDPEMTPYERYEAAFNLKQPDDYVPTFCMFGIWQRHFVKDRFIPIKEFATNEKSFAEQMETFYKAIGIDCLYTLCDMAELAQGYGVPVNLEPEEWVQPFMKEYAVLKEPSDCDGLEVLDPTTDGRMYLYSKAIKILADKGYKGVVPLIQETTSPITTMCYLAGIDNTMMWSVTDPEPLKRGLITIAKSTVEWIKYAAECGADYICHCMTRATKEIMTPESYNEIATPADEYVLKHSPSNLKFIIHACGEDPHLDEVFMPLAERNPNLRVVNYWDRNPKTPSLSKFKEKYGHRLCAIGGMDQSKIKIYNIYEIDAEVKDAMEQAKKGGGFIIGSGCDIATDTPIQNVIHWMYACRKYGRY
ncbi:MAG: uroporphyrinogen decarboxylase family protein [Fervidobacterium sp.]